MTLVANACFTQCASQVIGPLPDTIDTSPLWGAGVWRLVFEQDCALFAFGEWTKCGVRI